MRGNGLRAESYVAIASLDPSTADVVLEALREGGVAAYVEPASASPTAAINLTQPARPMERLYVDVSAEPAAREILDRQLDELAELASPLPLPDKPQESAGSEGAAPAPVPAPDATEVADVADVVDEDRIWAELVAGYHEDAVREVNPWPAVEDLDAPPPAAPSAPPSAAAKERDEAPAVSEAVAAASEAGDAAEAAARKPPEPERFVPPPPPPLPRLEPIMKAAWAAALGGPVLLLLSALAAGYVPSWFAPVGVVAFIAGLLVLLFRTRGGPPDDSDGAVI